MKHLYRSKQNKMIAGVAGGMAEYFNVDIALMRLIWVLAFFAGGFGFLAYIACLIIIPEGTAEENESFAEYPKETVLDVDEISQREARRRRNGGLFLIGLGIVFLVKNIVPWIIWNKAWPLLLVAVGAYILFRDHKGDQI